MSINIDKTNYILFSKAKNSNLLLNIDGINKKEVNETKFLGVQIDKKLSWENQIKFVVKNISRGVGILSSTKNCVDQDALLLIYNTLVLPYLNYCVEVWGNTFDTKLSRIKILQKRAIRIIAGLPHDSHTTKAFKKYKLLKFNDIIFFNTCLFIYKCKNNLQPTLVGERYNCVNNVHNHNTRNCAKMYQIRANKNLKGFCLSVRGVSQFNKLPLSIRQANSVPIFKKRLKRFIFDNY